MLREALCQPKMAFELLEASGLPVEILEELRLKKIPPAVHRSQRRRFILPYCQKCPIKFFRILM